MLYTLAFPTLREADAAFVARFRGLHDGLQADRVAPHFTLVFASNGVSEDAYLAHVEAVARRRAPVDFTCRHAMLGADGESETGYVFLVPDEGYSGLSRLHDRLYSGPLASRLRLDLPFVPHITVGRHARREVAKELCDALNDTGLCIPGRVETLAVSALEEGRVNTLATFALDGRSAAGVESGVKT